ncbi:MAG: DUF4139 domain-containing protein [Lewinellaceae bacterium]|nr:DUF4139 domain-containing protein [Lewinellaceae bacterium]
MRQTVFLVFVCIFCLSGFASAQSSGETKVPSQIEQVTVFQQSAQLQRTAEARIPTGKTTLVITGLSPEMDPASLRVTLPGAAATLLSVNHRRNFLERQEMDASMTLINNRLRRLRDSTQTQQALLETLQEEISFLQANRRIGSDQTAYSLAELQQISRYYADRLREIKLEQLQRTQLISRLDSIQNLLQQQLAQISAKAPTQRSEVVLRLDAKAPETIRIQLSYLCKGAGWFPTYDIKVDRLDQPIQLVYKARVYQNTGEDWPQVKLVFSNARPDQSGVLPDLPPYYLRPFQPEPYRYALNDAAYDPTVRVVEGYLLDENGEPLIGAAVLAKGTNIGTVTDFNGYYQITIPAGVTRLVYSYLGFTTQERVIDSGRKDVKLQNDDITLSEVVVTGYAAGVNVSRERKAAAPPPATLPTTIVEKTTNVEFALDIPYSVPSNGEQYTLDLATMAIPGQFDYQATPKLEKAAYLTAYITDWEQYNLLDGDANLFLEDTYLGRTLIDTRNLADTLKLSLGKDPGIGLERKLIQDVSKRGFLGSKKTVSRGYRLVVRNNKTQPIRITVRDQIPLSTSKEIEVIPVTLSDGTLQAETGELSWVIELKPGEQREWELRYDVRFPRELNIRVE